MILGFAILAGICFLLFASLDRGKKNGLLRNILVWLLVTIGLFSCSASVTTALGYKPSNTPCAQEYDSHGSYTDCE